MLKIIFRVAPTDWHGNERESIWAEDLGDGRYRLENSPFCAYGYSYEDVVEARPDENGDLIVGRIAERGGHSTYRIMIPKRSAAKFEKYWKPIEKLKCTYERATGSFVAVDVPPEADIDAVFKLLKRGEADGVWGFEEAHCQHGKPKVKPAKFVCWTGVAELMGSADNEMLPEGRSAFVRLFGRATDPDDFVSRANEMLRHNELQVIGFSEVQRVISGKLYGESEERFFDLLEQARKVAGPLFGTMHNFPTHSDRDELRVIFNAADPQGIFLGENHDEYDPEIELIRPKLPRCKTAAQAQTLIWDVFKEKFGADIAGPKSGYDELARLVFEWKKKNDD